MRQKLLLLGALAGITPVIAVLPARANSEDYCREYTKTVMLGGQRQHAYGMACYKPDGSWEIVNLNGDKKARNDVRTIIYADLGARPYYPSHFDNVIVVERGYRPAHFKPRHPHYARNFRQAAWYSSPFVFHSGFAKGSADHKHRTTKIIYNHKEDNRRDHSHGQRATDR